MMQERFHHDVVILIPVFNDWASVAELLAQIDSLDPDAIPAAPRLAAVVVNDGGDNIQPEELRDLRVLSVYILTLVRNFGHQQAIAIGLAYISQHFECTNVVVMDGDGEDLPSDIVRLMDAQEQLPGRIVFASRTQRSEGVLFRFFYFLYRKLFHILTGESLSFGNFCIIPNVLVAKLSHIPDISTHFAAGALKARLPMATIPLKRGKRLFGDSKMGFVQLIIHGLRAFAVYLDVISVRLMLASLGVALVAAFGMTVVVLIRCFTDLAIPGWGTSTVLGFAILGLQSLLSASVMGMLHLSMRNQPPPPPMLSYNYHIAKCERWLKNN
ncbi:MAG: glycosyltransferase [Thermodesulfobacteriota bacterium]